MKVLVAGGAGYIESVTTEMLCDAGHDVDVFDNLERGHWSAIDPRARFIQGDLSNKEEITKALQSTKAKTVLGWDPQSADLKTIVQSAWDWHQAHPNGYEPALH